MKSLCINEPFSGMEDRRGEVYGDAAREREREEVERKSEERNVTAESRARRFILNVSIEFTTARLLRSKGYPPPWRIKSTVRSCVIMRTLRAEHPLLPLPTPPRG